MRLLAIALSNLGLMYYFVPPTRTMVIDAAYIPSHWQPYLLHGSASESAALQSHLSMRATSLISRSASSKNRTKHCKLRSQPTHTQRRSWTGFARI